MPRFSELFLPRAQLQLSTSQVDLLSVVSFCLQTALILFAMKVRRSLLPVLCSFLCNFLCGVGLLRQFKNAWNRLLRVEIDVNESVSSLIGASVTLCRCDFLFATLADTSTCSSHHQVYMFWGLDGFRDDAATLPALVLHVISPRWHLRCVQSPIPALTFLPCSSNGPLSQSSSRVSTSFAVCVCNQVPHWHSPAGATVSIVVGHVSRGFNGDIPAAVFHQSQ